MKALIVLGVLVVLLAVLSRLRGRLGAEGTRKALHALMGVALVGLPFLELSVAMLWGVAGAALLLLGVLRAVPGARCRWGAVLHGVRRRSWGDLCFPVAALAAVEIAPSWRVYAAALLALALADTAAALAGQRWPVGRFRAWGGTKTLAGSAACFVTGAGVCVPLLGWLPGLAAAGAATVAEASTGRGLDNLTVPLAVLAVSAFPAAGGAVAAAIALLLALRHRRASTRRRARRTQRDGRVSHRPARPRRRLASSSTISVADGF